MREAAEPSPTARPAAAEGTLQCPTCRTVWRHAVTCPRCGTDLGVLMQVATQAWTLRQAARAALCAGNCPAEALALAREACRLHTTLQAQRLLALALLSQGEHTEAFALFSRLLTDS